MKRNILAAASALLLTIALALALGAQDKPANVAGTWQMTAYTAHGPFAARLRIQQDGETIKGTADTDYGNVSLTGAIKGNAIQFTWTLDTPGGTYTVVHDGTVTGDSMKGTFQLSVDSGSWSATRQNEK